MDQRVTKGMVLYTVMALVSDQPNEVFGEMGNIKITGQDIIDFCLTTLDQLERKTESNLKLIHKKKAHDPIERVLMEILTYEFVPLSDLVTKVNEKIPDTSQSKIISRLGDLYKKGLIDKRQQRDDKHSWREYCLLDQ